MMDSTKGCVVTTAIDTKVIGILDFRMPLLSVRSEPFSATIEPLSSRRSTDCTMFSLFQLSR